MNAINYRLFTFYLVLAVVFLTTGSLLVPSSSVQASNLSEFNTFPVTRYANPNASNTGNNNYFSITAVPDRELTLVASSGNQDLLLYSGASFRIQSFDKLIYYQAINWIPDDETALMAGSNTPPDTGGAVVRFDTNTDSFSIVADVPQNLMGMSTNDTGVSLITGGSLIPSESGVIYRYRNRSLEQVPSPDETIYHDVQWHPDGDRALLVGQDGSVLHWSGPGNHELHELPREQLLRTVAWHPSGNRALVGGTGGTLYLFESGEFTRITSDINWTVQDITWHPSGDFAILAGGLGKDDQGYWGTYRNYQTDWTKLSNPLFTAEWIDSNNALLGGQKVLWRVSRSSSASDFGLEASLSVSDPNPGVSEAVELSGFGSTYQANADSIDAYRFHYGTGDATDWRNEPNQRIEYLGAGRYEPELTVRGPTGETSTTSVSLTVGSAAGGSIVEGFDFYYWLTLLIFVLSLAVAYAALRF